MVGIRCVVLAVFVGLAVLAGCASVSPVQLEGTEVREYQGEKLSSIGDFRENSISGPRQVDKESYRLKIGGLVDSPQSLTYDEVIALPQYRKVVRLDCVEGWSVDILWDGVLLEDLMDKAGRRDEAVTVIFKSADGYSTSLSVDYVLRNKILLAFKMNDMIIPAERGFPFQVVAESKWGYKWAKWVTEVELSSDANFLGYWESRGYNSNGDLSGSMFSD